MELGQKQYTSDNPKDNMQATHVDKTVNAGLEKMHNKLKTESKGDGENGSALTSSKEFKINIETSTDSTDAPVLPLANISKDVASSFKTDEARSVEFSEEKDAPEMSTRVYDFEMVKEKTLPRVQLGGGGRGVVEFCTSQPKTHLLAWSLMGTSLIVCTIIFVLFWLIQ